MPTKVTAEDGDCLCGIAQRNGFNDCEPLRADPMNKQMGLCDRPLRAGDEVTIPEREEREEKGEGTEETHEHEAVNAPPASIRFVHGAAAPDYREHSTLDHLEISTFPSDKAGSDGTTAFPTGFGYNQDAHADPDTFMIEVVDPHAEGDEVTVTLNALKPSYAEDGTIEEDDDGNPVYEPFADSDADAGMREISVACHAVAPDNQVRFRSRYLRLVTDDEDFGALSGDPKRTDGTAQGLLVTDLADGNNTANDRLEILDQHVRAAYEVAACPAPENSTCHLYAQLPVGENRKRIRICVHVFRNTVGGSPGATLTEAHVRRRTGRWFRRAFAQINMAPKFVPCAEGQPDIEFLDPPPDNMLTISQDHGRPVTSTGGPYTLEFRLGLAPGDVADAEAAAVAAGGDAADARPGMEVRLANDATPEEVGEAVVAELPDGFSGVAIVNPRAFHAANGSCDVLITRDDNRRVMIENENVTAGAGITLTVARINMTNVQSNLPNSYVPLTPELRRLVHESAGEEDRLDVYICERFTGFSGLGLNPHSDLGAAFRPNAPLRWACFVNAWRVAAGDAYPWTYPHEAGHVMFDAIHVKRTDPLNGISLMTGSGTDISHSVDESKRITATPLLVEYGHWDPAQPDPGAFMYERLDCAARFRARGGQVTEDW